jgi:hypothetical protein
VCGVTEVRGVPSNSWQSERNLSYSYSTELRPSPLRNPPTTTSKKYTPHPLDMSTGLTRRRGGGGSAGAENENGDSARVASPAPKAGGSRDTGGPETSYESGENGHKIAFDPRDISESAERSKQPKLTLMEEVLLLGLKDKQVGGRRQILLP